MSGTDLYTISFFNNAFDNQPKPETLSWADICLRMKDHQILGDPIDSDNKDKLNKIKLSGWAFSPAEYEPGKPRLNENVRTVSLWVGDIDHATEQQIDEALETLKSTCIVVFTTYKHGAPCLPPEERTRIRVVAPYSRPVTPEEHARLWSVMNDRLSGLVDKSTKNPARIHFGPSTFDVSLPWSRCYNGKPIDVDRLLLEYKPPAPPAPPSQNISRTLTRARKWMAMRDGGTEGSRNATAFSTACTLANDYALNDQDALQLMREWNLRNSPPLEDKELVAVFESAKKNAQNPRGCKLMDSGSPSSVTTSQAAPDIQEDPTPEPDPEPHLSVVPEGAVAYVKASLEDAPVTDLAIIPQKYTIQTDGVYQWRKDKKGAAYQAQVISNPVVVQSWVSNNTTREKWERVAWKSGKWRSVVVPRTKLMNASKIVEALAGTGFQVNSGNARDVVAYLQAYWDANVKAIPNEEISEQLGWQHDGSFLPYSSTITYRPPDDGDQQLATSLSGKGALADWFSAVAWLRDFPRVQLAIYASLAAPLVELLDVDNFILDWAYRTSSGKSTALAIAASVWGRPDVGRFIGTWKSTVVAIERRSAQLNGLPLILDDTKQAPLIRGDSIVSSVIYDYCSGTGKQRGSITGTRTNPPFRSIMLTSGEQRIIDYSKDGGTAARAISMWGHPFDDQDVSKEIQSMNVLLSRNFGQIGPLFVRFLVQNRSKLPEWSANFTEISEQMRRMATDHVSGAVASRICKPLAVIEIASRLVHQAVELPWEFHSPVAVLFDSLTESAEETDRAKEAAEHAYRWAVSNAGRFYGRHETEYSNDGRTTSNQGWLGAWRVGSWTAIHFVPNHLIEELTRNGFDARAIIRLWSDRGWLEYRGDRRTRSCQWVGGESMAVISLKRIAVPESASPDVRESVSSEKPSISSMQESNFE